jgi:hypothetical protein
MAKDFLSNWEGRSLVECTSKVHFNGKQIPMTGSWNHLYVCAHTSSRQLSFGEADNCTSPHLAVTPKLGIRPKIRWLLTQILTRFLGTIKILPKIKKHSDRDRGRTQKRWITRLMPYFSLHLYFS